MINTSCRNRWAPRSQWLNTNVQRTEISRESWGGWDDTLFHTVIQGLRILPSCMPPRGRLQGYHRKVKRGRHVRPHWIFCGPGLTVANITSSHLPMPRTPSHAPHLTAGSLKIRSVPKRKRQSLGEHGIASATPTRDTGSSRLPDISFSNPDPDLV